MTDTGSPQTTTTGTAGVQSVSTSDVSTAPADPSLAQRIEAEIAKLKGDLESLVGKAEEAAPTVENVAGDVTTEVDKAASVLVPTDGFSDSREIDAAKDVGAVVSVLDPAFAPVVTGIEAAVDAIGSALGDLKGHAATLRDQVTTTKAAAPSGS
jgi:hypothetical protein